MLTLLGRRWKKKWMRSFKTRFAPAKIEGEHERLDVESVRSSMACHLGLEQVGVADRTTPESDALIELLLKATPSAGCPISLRQLCHWQSLLFVQGPELLEKVRVGELRGHHAMQVFSGRIDRSTVHYAHLESVQKGGLNIMGWLETPSRSNG